MNYEQSGIQWPEAVAVRPAARIADILGSHALFPVALSIDQNSTPETTD